MSEQIKEVWFTGSAGDRLSGRLDRPGAEPVAYALFAHCFAGSKIAAATRIDVHKVAAIVKEHDKQLQLGEGSS